MAREKEMKQLKNEKLNWANFTFLMTVGVLFAWSLVFGVLNPTVFNMDYLTGLVKVVGIVGIMGLVFSNKLMRWISLGLFTVCFLFVAAGFFLSSESASVATRIADLLTHTIQFMGGHRSQADLYELIGIWAICLVISLFVVIFSYFRFRFLILFIVSTLIFSVSMTSRYFSYTRVFYVFIFSILVLLMRHLHQKNRDKGVNPTPFTKYMLVLTAISLLIAAILPIPPAGFSEGIGQHLIQRPFNVINERLADLTQPNEFSLRQVGFGGSGRLGGDIVPNDDLFMRIQPDRWDTIYLTGAIMDTYTGYSWVNHFNDENLVDFNHIDQSLEIIEYAAGWELMWLLQFVEIPVEQLVLLDEADDFFDGWELDPAMRVFYDPVTEMTIWASTGQIEAWDLSWLINERSSEIEIDVLDLRPISVFHSGIVHQVVAQNVDELSFFRDRDGHFLAERRMPTHTRYRISYIEPEGRDFWIDDNGVETNRPQAAYRGLFNDVYRLLTTFYDLHGYHLIPVAFAYEEKTISFEELLTDHLMPRMQHIHDIYTRLPDEFPERVGELAFEITEEAANDYDRMRLLETYLSEHFAYTLTPGPTPRDRDFVDHFLFDLQAGYCVHFATAFVTMARSLGMPTRYVEGFLVHADVDVQRNDEGFIDVLNNMAHAWAEVYFEGMGWIRFEPTPASGLPQTPRVIGTDTSESGEFNLPFFDEQEQLMQQAMGAEFNGDSVTSQRLDAMTTLENETFDRGPLILVGIGSGLILIIGRVVFVQMKIRQVKKKKNNDAVLHLFRVMQSYLKVFKFNRQPDETAAQFTTRLGKELFGDLLFDVHRHTLLKRSAQIFAKARYSQLQVSDEERQVMEAVIQLLNERLKDEGRWKYFYNRYAVIKH